MIVRLTGLSCRLLLAVAALRIAFNALNCRALATRGTATNWRSQAAVCPVARLRALAPPRQPAVKLDLKRKAQERTYNDD